MPYIPKQVRHIIANKDKQEVYYGKIENAGELQYAIAVMLKDFMERKGLKYQNTNDIMGALAGAQMEFYRRVVAPYEDLKIEENGDV